MRLHSRAAFAVTALLLCAPCLAAPAGAKAAAPRCAEAARTQAAKLLAFHSDNDERAEVGDEVERLPSIVNPANAKQRFEVLQVWGYIYKGEYRMRLLYYPMAEGDCVLMGQEILEHASL
ncbi:hypothetical protein [Xanthomonas sp. 1678]|uniref:hypothetical protein n=1 Tax=Xanthomonas sp. 1678 TaxID=3158788 RepID=UPI00285D0120|nr:hypothetical protein [Xanthomonas translucens]